MAKTNNKTATNVFFTDSSLAGFLPESIVYLLCYGRLNRQRFCELPDLGKNRDAFAWPKKAVLFAPVAGVC
jgi:hypothetical protein